MIEWSDVDWGNAPSWGALVAAIVAASFAGRNVLVDRHDREREQAAKVAAWWAVRDVRVDQRFGIIVTEYGAWLRNASEVPVYDVEVKWLYGERVYASERMPLLPPQAETVFLEIPKSSEASDDSKTLGAIDEVDGGLAVRLTFRDSAGKVWHRSEHGRLIKVRPKRGSRGC